MKVSELQSLMARNRTAISFLEVEADTWKELRNFYAACEQIESEYYYHKLLQLTKKEIAKLVSLQKSLKREIREKVEMASERNALNLYYTRLHAHLDSAK